MPHIPQYASPEFGGKSKGGLYGDCVEEIDDSVGQLLAALRQGGIDRNTFVFFSSDNGPLDNRYAGTDSVFFNSTAGLRGYKGSLYEGGFRVPCLVRWKGRGTMNEYYVDRLQHGFREMIKGGRPTMSDGRADGG